MWEVCYFLSLRNYIYKQQTLIQSADCSQKRMRLEYLEASDMLNIQIKESNDQFFNQIKNFVVI